MLNIYLNKPINSRVDEHFFQKRHNFCKSALSVPVKYPLPLFYLNSSYKTIIQFIRF